MRKLLLIIILIQPEGPLAVSLRSRSFSFSSSYFSRFYNNFCENKYYRLTDYMLTQNNGQKGQHRFVCHKN